MTNSETKTTSTPSNGFNPYPTDNSTEQTFPLRDNDNKKLQAADLFSLFTADIIKEEVTFTR